MKKVPRFLKRSLATPIKQIIYIWMFFILASCGQSESQQVNSQDSDTTKNNPTEEGTLEGEQKQKPEDFIPKGFVNFEKISGDLNKDGVDDCVILIKGTDKSKIVTVEDRGKFDRNRRGLIVLFNKNGHYELAAKNYDCFSSENEDGGVYFPPELSIKIKNNNLFARYEHGRYGHWQYTFKHQNTDFALIGYDQSESNGPVIERETSINFLSKKKQEKVNTNENAEGGDEVFKETWQKINVDKLIQLSEIKDFDELDISGY